MKKHTALFLLGGNGGRAAKLINRSRQTVAGWSVDEADNIQSRQAVDSVLAALVRLEFEHLKATKRDEPLSMVRMDYKTDPPKLVHFDVTWDYIEDLLAVPERD